MLDSPPVALLGPSIRSSYHTAQPKTKCPAYSPLKSADSSTAAYLWWFKKLLKHNKITATGIKKQKNKLQHISKLRAAGMGASPHTETHITHILSYVIAAFPVVPQDHRPDIKPNPHCPPSSCHIRTQSNLHTQKRQVSKIQKIYLVFGFTLYLSFPLVTDNTLPCLTQGRVYKPKVSVASEA